MISRLSYAMGVALLLSACQPVSQAPMQSPPLPSASVYSSSETMSAMRVASDCLVVQSRFISIVGDSQQDMQRDQVNTVVGAAAGALIGRAIGNEIGGGSGQRLSKNLGTLAGGVVGAGVAQNINAERRTRTGVEYTVNLGSSGYRTIVQNLNPGEQPLQAGSSCTVVGNGNRIRVQ